MYITVRKYSTDSMEILIEKIKAEFVPIIKLAPGFIDYYVVPLSEESLMTVNLFDTEVNGTHSNTIARKWIEENISYMYAGPPEILEGEAIIAQ